jgi:hypothetical protein
MALAGFVYAPFRGDDLLSNIFGPNRNTGGVDFTIYDGPRPATMRSSTARMIPIPRSVQRPIRPRPEHSTPITTIGPSSPQRAAL